MVELLNDLVHGLDIFKVRGEFYFLLFEVDEVLIGLKQRFYCFLTPPVVGVDVLEQLSQRQHVLLLVCRLELWVFGECSLHFLIYLSILFGVCLFQLHLDLLDSVEVFVVLAFEPHFFYPCH